MLQNQHHYDWHPSTGMGRQEKWIFNNNVSSVASEGSFQGLDLNNFYRSGSVDVPSKDVEQNGFDFWTWNATANAASLEMQRQRQNNRQRDSCLGDKEKQNKLCHNAYERERRKRVNSLYQRLNSLLPASSSKSYQKAGNPAILLRALKYIPSLMKEINILERRRDEMLNKSRKSQATGAGSADKSVSLNNEPIVNVFIANTEVMITVGITLNTKHRSFFALIVFLQQRDIDVVTASMVVSSYITWNTIHIHTGKMLRDKADLRLEIMHFFQSEASPDEQITKNTS